MRVTIRPLEETDAKTSYVWRNDPEVWTHTISRPNKVITLEDELSWIRNVTKEKSSKRFAIVADGTYVGNIYLTDIEEKQAEYHIFIGEKSFWGKGVARQATRQILSYAKHKLKLSFVVLEVKKENIAAHKLYESIGFEEIGAKDSIVTMRLKLSDYESNH